MPTSYRAYFPDQGLLLPSSLSEWLPEDHLAYFIGDTVDAMDLDAFHARYEGDGRRCQPFDPRMMVKVLIYGYASGVFSSRKMAASFRGVALWPRRWQRRATRGTEAPLRSTEGNRGGQGAFGRA